MRSPLFDWSQRDLRVYRAHSQWQGEPNRPLVRGSTAAQARPIAVRQRRSRRISRAALRPGLPDTPPPGWVPAPHVVEPLDRRAMAGVAQTPGARPTADPATGGRCMMSPPARPKVRSRSSGERIIRPRTAALKLGAQALTVSMIRSAAASRTSSQERPSGRSGANCWQNRLATCWPGGARLSSRVEGISISTIGFRDQPKVLASR